MGRHDSRKRPRALFVTPTLPNDRGNGLAMRAGFLLDSYAKAFDVDVCVVPAAGQAPEITPYVERRARRARVLGPVVPDTQFSLLCRLADREARLAAFRQYGRPSAASGVNAALREALMDWVGDADYSLVHIFRVYLSDLAEPWLHDRTGTPYLVLDCDEDDVSAYRRLAGIERKRGRRAHARWLEAEALAFKVMAERRLPSFDLLLAASRDEARALRARAGDGCVNVVPNTVPSFSARRPARRIPAGRRDIVFVGNMSYLPNIDAVTWFASRIWPKIRAAASAPVRFVVVGHDPSPGIEALGRGHDIVVTGGVEDVESFYRDAAIAIAPIRAGGGTRIKLLEAAGFGVPMVATSFGAAGTDLRPGVEILLADRESDFAAACVRLLTDRQLARRLAARAQRKARFCYGAGNRSRRFLDIVESNLGVTLA